MSRPTIFTKRLLSWHLSPLSNIIPQDQKVSDLIFSKFPAISAWGSKEAHRLLTHSLFPPLFGRPFVPLPDRFGFHCVNARKTRAYHRCKLLKTLTSLNKEFRSFCLGENSIVGFPSFRPLAITASGGPEGDFNLAIRAFGAFEVHCLQIL